MATLNLQSCFCYNKIVFKDYLLFFPSKACNCSDTGSINLQCDVLTGQCQCKAEFGGQDCSRCALGYRDYPDCVACDCDLSGTTAEMCDDTEGLCGCEEETGICTCKVLKYSDFLIFFIFFNIFYILYNIYNISQEIIYFLKLMEALGLKGTQSASFL